jgi:hypothetical protein
MNSGGTQDLGAAAAAALPDLHAALYGFAPQETRAWTDSSAILVVVRTDACGVSVPGHSRTSALAELHHAVGDAVFLRSGEMLRARDRRIDAERGLMVLAFERSSADDLAATRTPALREPLADAS